MYFILSAWVMRIRVGDQAPETDGKVNVAGNPDARQA